MNKAVTSARSDDISSLKRDGLGYIALDLPGGAIVPIIPAKASKSVRGFNHPVLGRLLCPLRYLAAFEADPEE